MEATVTREGKTLRLGYTTGSCAAAAAKAAAWMLLTGRKKETLELDTPKGLKLQLKILDIVMGEDFVSCAVEKDSGDDPDITRGAWIYARVSRSTLPGIQIDGGTGVGRVTTRGLDQPPGAAAINSVPRQMIRENLEEVCRLTDYRKGLEVLISVPGGEELAKKTFNPRLGIQGGISILGTSGIVEPMSEQALVDTIRLELRQRKENGFSHILLTPGNYGADYIRNSLGIPPERAVLCSNFIGEALDCCRELSFRAVLLVGHIGKLIKLAGGMMNTHSRYGDCRMELLAAHAAAEGLDARQTAAILRCVTCDEALLLLRQEECYPRTMNRIAGKIGRVLAHRTEDKTESGAILFSKEYGSLCETENAAGLLKRIREEY